jgi:TonB dependent receptor/TonB-dependent Receptor Plug Domain/CarboxypepD_reg-like domain
MSCRSVSLFVLLFLLLPESYAQKVVNGFIKDYFTGESLAGVSITDSATARGVVSNQYGFFSIKVQLPATVNISSVGYEPTSYSIQKWIDTTHTFEIKPIAYQLSEVVITATRDDFQTRKSGNLSIPMERLNSIPTILGEKDIFRALSLTPGISVGNEGTVGLYIRGGTPDQNLILLDEAPIYNSAHFFGIMSVFNSEALKKVEVYKSILPAQYGGRVSSVIDVTMKEGNTKLRKKEHGIGLLSSTILFEGPLSYKNRSKGSYLVSGRTAYLGLATLPLWFAYQFGNSQQYFNYLLYDINAKLNFKIDQKSHLYLSVYNSYDRWDAREKYSTNTRGGLNINWGNLTGTLRYNRILKPNLFLKAVALFTRYRYNIGVNTLEKMADKFETTDFYSLNSSLGDITAKTSIEYFRSSSHTIRMGIEATRHTYRPTAIRTSFELERNLTESNNRIFVAHELGAFTEQEFQVANRLSLNAGLRFNTYSIQNTSYHSWEPRLSINWLLPQDWAIKGGFTQIRQFLHLLSTNSVGLPNDVWVPATGDVPPQFARQYAIGLFKNYPSKKVTVSLEGYYKALSDQIDYRQGASLFTNAGQPWETLIEKGGIGSAYGLEFFLNKTEGSFTGWLAYTLAWTKSKFENINNGEWFYGNFDRRHTISLTSNYKLSPSVNMSANWTFNTGRPVTVPEAIVPSRETPNQTAFIYGDRNNFRMPVYHRLDAGVNWDRRSRKNRTVTWSVGAYNIYNRRNPFYVNVVGSRTVLPTGNFDYRLYSYGFVPVIPYVGYVAKI